jgi:hypothetical protein
MHKLKRKLGRNYQITQSFGTMVGGLNLESKVEVTCNIPLVKSENLTVDVSGGECPRRL